MPGLDEASNAVGVLRNGQPVSQPFRSPTSANCWAIDLFFDNRQQWERDWDEQRLRDDSHLVRATTESALHDTVKATDMAENFGCFPEQLSERVRRLPDDY
jgi:hypothetical protein